MTDQLPALQSMVVRDAFDECTWEQFEWLVTEVARLRATVEGSALDRLRAENERLQARLRFCTCGVDGVTQ